MVEALKTAAAGALWLGLCSVYYAGLAWKRLRGRTDGNRA